MHDPIPLSSQAAGLSLVGAAIHWSDAEGRLWRADPDPNAVPPVMYDAHIPGVGPLAVAGNDAYIVTPDGIWRAPVRAEAGEMIVDGPIAGAWDVIVVGARIYWTTLGGGGTRAGVFRAPVEGGVAERIYTAAEAQVTGYLTASGPYVYFGMLGEDRVLRHRIDAGAFPDPP